MSAKYDVNLAPNDHLRCAEPAVQAHEEWFGDVVLDGKGNVYITGDQWLDASAATTRQ